MTLNPTHFYRHEVAGLLWNSELILDRRFHCPVCYEIFRINSSTFEYRILINIEPYGVALNEGYEIVRVGRFQQARPNLVARYGTDAQKTRQHVNEEQYIRIIYDSLTRKHE